MGETHTATRASVSMGWLSGGTLGNCTGLWCCNGEDKGPLLLQMELNVQCKAIHLLARRNTCLVSWTRTERDRTGKGTQHSMVINLWALD